MNAKQYLSQYRLIDKRIESKTEQLMRLRARMQSLTASYSDMPRGGQRKDWTDVADQCIAIELEIGAEIKDQLRTRHDILAAIESIQSPLQRSILEMRYLNCWSWRKIICSLPLEEAQVYRLHYDALQTIKVPETA